MTDVSEGRGFFVVDKHIVDRDEAALVCATVLHVLRDDLSHVRLDAYSDYEEDMPAEVKAVQGALRDIGAAEHRRDPGMGIDLDLADPDHARLVHVYAPWSINVDLLGPRRMDMGCFHDCAYAVHFRATPEQAIEITARLTSVRPVVSLSTFDGRRRERRREQGRERRAARRARILGWVRR